MEIPKFLKPREYKPLDIPRIRDLDLRRSRVIELPTEQAKERKATIVYQRKG